MTSDVVLMRTYPQRIDADLARAQLEAFAVVCSVADDSASGEFSRYHLYVRAEDVDRARELLAAGGDESAGA